MRFYFENTDSASLGYRPRNHNRLHLVTHQQRYQKNPPVLWLPKTLTVNLNILVHSMLKAIEAVANVALAVSMPQIDNDTVLLNL